MFLPTQTIPGFYNQMAVAIVIQTAALMERSDALHQAAAPGLTLCWIMACLCSISLFSTAESITSWSS